MSGALYASPLNATVESNLGLLEDLRGQWSGSGFDLVARPDGQEGRPFALELTATHESIEFVGIDGVIPIRGSAQGDIGVHALHYLRHVADRDRDSTISVEPGLWARVPPTTVPSVCQETYVRQAAFPDGTSVLAQSSTAVRLRSGPIIAPVETNPFTGPVPQLNETSMSPEADADHLRACLGRDEPAGLPPGLQGSEVVKDPTRVLRAEIENQRAAGNCFGDTVVLQISTTPVGGIVSIPFVAANANAIQLDATFWIESVTHPGGEDYLQLQYVQRVVLDFIGVRWPHISVATLRKR